MGIEQLRAQDSASRFYSRIHGQAPAKGFEPGHGSVTRHGPVSSRHRADVRAAKSARGMGPGTRGEFCTGQSDREFGRGRGERLGAAMDTFETIRSLRSVREF